MWTCYTYLPDFRKRVFVHRNLGVDPGSRIAVPMPDATDVGSGFHNLALEALLTKLVHQVNSTKPSADNQDIGLKFFGIVLIVRRGRLVGRTDIYK
jgi:hypothetical protein